MKLWESHKENSLFVNNKVFLNSFAISFCSFASTKKFMRFFALNFALVCEDEKFSQRSSSMKKAMMILLVASKRENRVVVQTLYFYLSKWLGYERCKKSNWYHGKKQGEWEKLFLGLLLLPSHVVFIWVLVMHLCFHDDGVDLFVCVCMCREEIKKVFLGNTFKKD